MDMMKGDLPERCLTIPLTYDKKTQSYFKFAKVLLVLQISSFKVLRKCWEELYSIYRPCCRLISQEECSMIYDHKCVPAVRSTFCRLELQTTCQQGYNVVVVGVPCIKGVEDLRDLAYIAYQTKYVLIFQPMHVPLKKELVVRTVTISHGFFLNDTDSVSLREHASLYLKDCLEIPLFMNFYKNFNLTAHYQLDRDPSKQPLLYSAARFCVRGFKDFHKCLCGEAVDKAHGKIQSLKIVGFLVTPNAVVARIRLTSQQEELWAVKDDDCFPIGDRSVGAVDKDRSEIVLLPTTARKSRGTLQNDFCRVNKKPSRGRGHNLYFLVGESVDSTPSSIRLEVSEAIGREAEPFGVGKNWLDIGKAYLKYCGKYWIVYLKMYLTVEAVFASLYYVR